MSDTTAQKGEQSQGAGAPDQNAGTQTAPGGQQGGSGAPVAPGQAASGRAGTTSRTGQQTSDDPEFDRAFAKGRKAGKREVHEEIEQAHGKPIAVIIDEWKHYVEAAAKGERAESAELTKLQRQIAQAQAGHRERDDRIAALTTELDGYRVTTPIQSAVRRVSPKSERYEQILVAEMRRRVKLDDDGELTVLSAEGKPLHKLSLDDLARELAESMPDLVTPPRTGTGVRPAAPVVQPADAGRGVATGANAKPQRAERIAILQKIADGDR